MTLCSRLWCCRHQKPPRVMMAFDLDETLFFAKRNKHTAQQHLDCRHLPGDFISQINNTNTCRISEDNYVFYFLNTQGWSELLSRLLKNNVDIILITNGSWQKKSTINRLNRAFKIELTPNTHFLNRVDNKPNKLRYAFPYDDICLLDDKNDHLQSAIQHDIDFIHVRTKAELMDLNTHINAAHHWLDLQLSHPCDDIKAISVNKLKSN